MKRIFFSTLIIAAIFTSCSSDDDAGTPISENVEAPATYTFERDGQSTVSFSGQTTRILMAGELVSAFNDFDNATQESLQNMFAHVEGAEDFSDPDLNASDKSVRSKTAASKDFFGANATESSQIKATFDGYIATQINEVFPNQNVAATPGVAGQIADGSSARYVTGNGLEMNQTFAKGLIGALMADQMLNNYLGTAVLDEADNRENNNNDVTAEDKPYTTMEHKWDEAYGYLFGASTNAANPLQTLGEDDAFLNKYLGRVEGDSDFAGIAQDVYDAFKLGRAAIVAKNYEVRDAQAEIIREKISEVIAIRAVHYLQSGKTAIENQDFGAAFHDLSEGYGFVYSLRFTRNNQDDMSYFSRSEVDGFIEDIMTEGPNGLWDVTPATLDAVSTAIAAKFDFTVAQAATTD
ncbi:DUF4856 domain-containing protein [Marinirhabdus gelatinilytica]|uniref:Uncharacterized protein DUF4856 n=1 Tax=Marinirhabdus gelatinilytica TaxID=1703343 RepID=A0A370QEY9_9FLAO|nr:DUF4856 domain-containing protein [Marinirhabdus gelatinilytica]RDK86937.1 uncharacterized protein DUF4856 [Marinirhabdus gelatinilytica]